LRGRNVTVAAKGATKYIISIAGSSPSFALFGGTSAPGAYQSTRSARVRLHLDRRLRSRRHGTNSRTRTPSSWKFACSVTS